MALWLSKYIVVGTCWRNLSSCNNYLNYMAFVIVFIKAMYSNFVDDKAIDFCFLLPQEITPLASKKKNLEVEQ